MYFGAASILNSGWYPTKSEAQKQPILILAREFTNGEAGVESKSKFALSERLNMC